MTRHEYNQLRKIYNALMEATVTVGTMIVSAHSELVKEDDANTALEQSNKGANHGDDRPV